MMSGRINLIIPITHISAGLINRLDTVLNWMKTEIPDGVLIAVFNGYRKSEFEQAKEHYTNHSTLKCILVNKKTGTDACVLCGIKASTAKYTVTLDEDGLYSLNDIKILLSVIEKSNCKLVYGYTTIISPGFLGNLRYRVRANTFSLLTGLPAYISDFRIMEQDVSQAVQEDQQKAFMLDSALIGTGCIYAGVPVGKRSKSLMRKGGGKIISKLNLENLLAASYIPEMMIILLLSLNIYFLYAGWIWQSTAVAITVAVSIVNVYSVKWYRVKAFRIKDEFPIE